MKSISSIVDRFIETGKTQSAHTDELVNEGMLKRRSDLFHQSIRFYNEAIAKIYDMKVPLVHVELYIELLSSNTDITGVSPDLKLLIEQIDDFSMPEIYISKPVADYWQPKIEMYVSPLPFEIKLVLDDVNIYYQEYRLIDDQIDNVEYTRWLKFSYLKTE